MPEVFWTGVLWVLFVGAGAGILLAALQLGSQALDRLRYRRSSG